MHQVLKYEYEYVVLNDVRMADIRLASPRLFTCLVYVSTYCMPIALLRQNKPFRLLFFGPTETQVWIVIRAAYETKQNFQCVRSTKSKY